MKHFKQFVTLISMQTKIAFCFLCFSLFPTFLFSQIERVIVETYYVSDVFDSTDTYGGKLEVGSVTYRIYVDLKPGNKLLKIYGDANHALKFSSTKSFFNNLGDGQSFAKDIKKSKYFNNTLALDTWLTLGQTSTTQGGKTYFGILKRQDNDGSFIGGSANNDGGSAGIANGLLTNTISTLGIPLVTADGMDTMATLPSGWDTHGIVGFPSGIDTTMFGSVKSKSEFVSNYAWLKNLGVRGVNPDSNQILVAQLTTKGALAFELNIEVEELINNVPTVIKYVANDNVLLPGEKKNSYLKFPFAPPVCGCMDANFIEYNQNFECAENDSCKNRIVFGCTDTMACNFDPHANFSIKTLCCYPGSCGGRDISLVCPGIRGANFDFNIYPNPASKTIFLNVTSGQSQEITYSVFNSFGTEVLKENMGANERIINHEIDLSHLTNSLYLIRVNVGDSFLSKQFIKNE